MKILHKYVLRLLLRNLALSILTFALLFWIFDFFDRIDNILPEDTEFTTVVAYFLYKLPMTFSYVIPIGTLVASLFTIGLLSRSSEVTAMRAAGVKVMYIARPLLMTGFAMTLVTIFINEAIVPYSQRRTREIYNIDIRKKTERGGYSQSDFWWRSGNLFYSVDMFDSRTNTLTDLTALEISEGFELERRWDAARVDWVDDHLGWSMSEVVEYKFEDGGPAHVSKFKALPLPIDEKPKDFYSVKTDPFTMSFRELSGFIANQAANGVPTAAYLVDLHAKIAFPFINLVIPLVVLPFALLPARSGSMAPSFLAGLTIGFTYFAVHSFSLALGRAELWPPIIAAWMANFIMGAVGMILNLGTEAPN